MSLWLVRHASTNWTGHRWCGSSDPLLTRAGRRSAIELGGWLARSESRPTSLLVSPARRARQTAAGIALVSERPLECRVEDDLREFDFGAAEGSSWAEIERRWPRIAGAILSGERYVDWPAGESAADARSRVVRLSRLLMEQPPGTVVVTHGGVIAGLLPGDPVGAAAPATAVLVERAGERWVAATARR